MKRLLLVGGMLWAGCTIIGPDPVATFTIRTDQTEYRPGDRVSVVIRNDSPTPIYYNTCLEVVLEAVDTGMVAREYSFPVCECLCYATMEPDTEISGDVMLSTTEAYPPAYSYRLRYLLHRNEARDRLLDLDQRRSNSFSINSR